MLITKKRFKSNSYNETKSLTFRTTQTKQLTNLVSDAFEASINSGKNQLTEFIWSDKTTLIFGRSSLEVLNHTLNQNLVKKK